MAHETKRPLKVFLCHASGDKPVVRDLYKRLITEGVDAWLDQEKLLPGQDWRVEIPRAVRESDVVVICLSNKSITKEGYIQKEIKFALDSAEEKPEGTIFLIPARLEDCVVPERLDRWQWVDLFDENGFARLLRSLKLRADRVGAALEPSGYESEDQEIERKLDQLYTEGLAAFYTEDWDRAYQRFQAILRERPNHKYAAEKLAQAERQRNLMKLYAQATEAYELENWLAAIKTLEELLEKSGDYKDAVQLLKDAKKQRQIRDLYTEAKRLHAAQKWQAVIRVFDQSAGIDPVSPDPEGLLPTAQKEAAELKRLDDLNDLYRQGVHKMDAGQWHEARGLLEQVHKAQTGFLDTERLLRKVENEIVKIEELNQRNIYINTLYEQAHGLVRSENWRKALDKVEEIQKLDNQFVDKDGIFERVKIELEREEEVVQQQNELAAMYAEAMRLLKDGKYQEALDKWQEVWSIDPKYPDRQRVQSIARRKLTESGKPSQNKPRLIITKPIWIGIIGFIAISLVTAGVIFSSGANQQAELTAQAQATQQAASIQAGLTQTDIAQNLTQTVAMTNTVPTRTNTPQPSTSVPTIIVSTDPTMYDDFNNPAYDGRFNTALWGGDISVGKIAQENGLLTLELNTSYRNIGLNPTQDYKPTYPIFVESKLMLDPTSKDGTVFIGIGSSGGTSICGIGTANTKGGQGIYCTSEYFGTQQRVYTRGITPGTWHVLRIELDPDTMTFTYLIDGEKLGLYTPLSPEKYENLSYGPLVHVDSGINSDPSVTGYTDYVKFGKIEE